MGITELETGNKEVNFYNFCMSKCWDWNKAPGTAVCVATMNSDNTRLMSLESRIAQPSYVTNGDKLLAKQSCKYHFKTSLAPAG